MNGNLNLKFSDTDRLKEWLENVHEKYYIELKKASELPRSFWESYSSFCNTSGGWIILGVIEHNPKNEIVGVANVEKAITSLWDILSNRNKVNYRNIENQDVNVINFGDKKVIFVRVREVLDVMKPIYIDGKQENTWVRTGDGDRIATPKELASMIRNSQPIYDSLPADKFSIEDLDPDSVITYKEKVNKRYPKKNYIEMSAANFLREIGAAYIDRETKEYKLRKGTILFLGKVNAIKELFPHYHVDFFNQKGNSSRWIDRVTEDEPGDYEMNLYNFYTIVYEKIKILMKEAFELDNQQLRIPVSDFDEPLRECLVNCLAHADYVQGYPSIKIDVYDGWFNFKNPGKMLVTKEQFVVGGDSRPRNEVVMKLFRLLGASERQGFGGPLIFKSANTYDFRKPEVVTDLEHTELRVWNIDLVDSYPDLSNEQKDVFRVVVKMAEPVSVADIVRNVVWSDYKVRKAINVLADDRNLIQKIGNGVSTRYVVSSDSVESLTQMQIEMAAVKSTIS